MDQAGTLDPQEGNDRNQDLFKFQIPAKIPTVSVSVFSCHHRISSVLQQERIWSILANVGKCAGDNLATVVCHFSGNLLHFQRLLFDTFTPTSHQIPYIFNLLRDSKSYCFKLILTKYEMLLQKFLSIANGEVQHKKKEFCWVLR